MPDLLSERVPFITPELPGIGGTIRLDPEDFEVEELPAYEPSGVGDHLFLWVEKRGLNTRDVARELGRAAGVGERDVGLAGQKDRHALTRQFFSLPVGRLTETSATGLSGEGWRVLSARRHENKLKLGHLRGNRFTITVRHSCPDAEARARAIAQAIEGRGLPNAFGPQRFGWEGKNALLGAALVKGTDAPDLARVRRDRFLRRMAISAYQALLFNRALAARMEQGDFARALRGDLMKKRETGGLFHCEDVAVDSPRVASFEISPTGPLFGHRMIPSRDEAWTRERALLDAEGLELDTFAPLKGDGEGTRRPFRIPVTVAIESRDATTLTLRFALPKGSFATTLLAELMKPEGEGAVCDLADERD